MIAPSPRTDGPGSVAPDEPTLLHTLFARANDPAEAFTYLDMEEREVRQSAAELVAAAEAIGRALLARGLTAGARVGVILPEARQFVPTFWGLIRARLVPVPMAPPVRVDNIGAWMRTAEAILEAAEARLVIVDPELAGLAWALGTARAALTVADLRDDPRRPLPRAEEARPQDLCFLQFTSGSTSRPKGVRVTHGNLIANTDAIMRDGLRITPTDRGLSWLPLYHDMGLIGFVISTFRYRVPTTLLPTLRFVMKPSIWMRTASAHKATISFAPNFAYALATRRTPDPQDLDLRSLRVLGCGAEPIHPQTQRDFFAHFAPAGLDPRASLACYGMAEATLAMAFMPLEAPLRTELVDAKSYRDEHLAVPAVGEAAIEVVCCGRPMAGHEIRVLDDQGAPLPERRVGEIAFLGPSVADGYQGNPDATAASFRPDGLRTGDLGYLADGMLFVTGRKKDLIILNGRNYDPHDIEWQAANVEGVRRGNVVAFSVPGDDSERLVVVLETARTPPEDLAGPVREHILRTMGLSATVVCLPPGRLTKTSSGKLQRQLTRQLHLEGALQRAPGALERGALYATVRAKGLARRLLHTIRPDETP